MEVVPLAFGDVAGEMTIHVCRNSDLSSFLELSAYGRSTFPGITEPLEAVTVPVRRLDAIADGLIPHDARRIFLKTDTQGFDLAVLRGAAGLYSRIVGIQMELSLKPLYKGMPDITEGLEALRSAECDVTGFFPVIADSSGAIIEIDCVARKRTQPRPPIESSMPPGQVRSVART